MTANSGNHNKTRPELLEEAKVNVKCNKLASGVSNFAKEGNKSNRRDDVIQPLYEGSRAMLKVNGLWITSNLQEHVLHASHEPLVRSYYNRKFGWKEGTFDMVYWKSVR